ncbi:Farnesyl pyrophosphate synthase [Orchesella cincta]|uniref:Farnesyl pyrophosphate synthase n=1 Tax=Orchesella cincta TaxID=48709 RepID=A0A1D2MDB2_ORCCI|nr:Farnesyl pyrophosphate synthase [Orchesella cincta]
MKSNFTRMLKVGRECVSRQCNYSSYRTPILVSNISSYKTKCESIVGNSIAPPLSTFTPVRGLAQIGQNIIERPQLLTEAERKDFMHVYQTIVKDLLEMPSMEDMKETNRWVERVLHYNVTHGKHIRGQTTAMAYKHFALGNLTNENMRLSYILGWCVEILHAGFLLLDDIMDASETRRGRQCWYKVDNLGLTAINDGMLLETSIYQILGKFFKDKNYFNQATKLIFDVMYQTVSGECLDLRTGKERMEKYTMERYTAVVKYKTSLYSIYLPFALAMTMAEIDDPALFQEVRSVALEMGHFLQARDDFLDCFGDVEITGKVGTDIETCKCSWLFVVAMENCSPEQKKLLMENYGQPEPEKVSVVKNLYDELRLEDMYRQYEEQAYNSICTQIQQMNNRLPKEVFLFMLHANTAQVKTFVSNNKHIK